MTKMFKKIFLIIPVLCFYCCAQQQKEAEKTQQISGFSVFKKNCVTCHGNDGRMGLNGAKPLPDSKMSLEERITHINNGKGAMQPYKGVLSPAEIKAVAAYTMTLK
jgi:cytochrome c6